MKKSIALIGAFFMGAFAFAQVSKTDTINKTAGRKVLSNDMQNVSTDTESEAQSKDIKGSVTQKGTSKVMLTKKESVDSETESQNMFIKGREGWRTTSESQRQDAYKITLNKADAGAAAKSQSQDAYKITMSRAEAKANGETQSKPAYKMTTQSARAESDGVIQKGRENRGAVKAVIEKDDSINESDKASDPYLKISSVKKE